MEPRSAHPGGTTVLAAVPGGPELIDHIFASNFLVTNDRVTAVTTMMAEGAIPSIEDDPTARRGAPGSDHAAVVATFDF